jgi:hypothetical protein
MGIALWVGYQWLRIHWIYIVLVAGFLALFAWSTIAGVRLWRGEPKGWKWATILFVLQIPVLTVPGVSYEFYTGLALKIFGGETVHNFGFNLGASVDLNFGTDVTGLIYGVNIVAIAAVIYLLRNRPGKIVLPATPQTTPADA